MALGCSCWSRCGFCVSNCSLSLADSQSRVILRIVLVFSTIVGDSANDLLWVVAAGEGALGESPVPFRLGYLASGRRSPLAR